MAQPGLPSTLLPSLKDRLLDPESMGARGQLGYTLQEIFASVRDDLEDLLNTRRSFLVLGPHYAEVARSIVTYGLPDLASIDTSTLGKREELGRIMAEIITLHEPRLRNVRASMVKGRALDLTALFHIDAELRLDPAPAVAFETVVELTTGHASIRERAQP
jgi:type VI secretion system protein ImpF